MFYNCNNLSERNYIKMRSAAPIFLRHHLSLSLSLSLLRIQCARARVGGDTESATTYTPLMYLSHIVIYILVTFMLHPALACGDMR